MDVQYHASPPSVRAIPPDALVRVTENIRFLSTQSRKKEITGIRTMCELDSSCREYVIRALNVLKKIRPEIATNPRKLMCLLVIELTPLDAAMVVIKVLGLCVFILSRLCVLGANRNANAFQEDAACCSHDY